MRVQTDMKANVLAVFGFSVVIIVYGTKCKYFISHSATKWVKFDDSHVITDASISDQKDDSGGTTHLQSKEFWEGQAFFTSGFVVRRS